MTLAQFMLPGEAILFEAEGKVYYRRTAYELYVTGERLLLHAMTGRLVRKERVVAEALANIRLLEYSEGGIFSNQGWLDVGFPGNTLMLTGEPETIKGIWRALQCHTLNPQSIPTDNEVTLVAPPAPLFDDLPHPPAQVEPIPTTSLHPGKPAKGPSAVMLVALCLLALAAVATLFVNSRSRRVTQSARVQMPEAATPVASPTPAPTPVSVLVMDETFTLEEGSHRAVNFTLPAGAGVARVSGGFRVTSGRFVDFYVMNESQYNCFATGGPPDVTSAVYRIEQWNARVGERLSPGTYYLVFDDRNSGVGAQTVAAEFFVVYDKGGTPLPIS